MRLIGGGIIGVALLALWVYCILDVIATDESLTRNMPKIMWLIVVIILPTVGSVAWFALGRPSNAGYRLGDTTPRRARPAIGPEDSPGFMSRIDDRAAHLSQWEDDLKRREEELKRREEDQ